MMAPANGFMLRLAWELMKFELPMFLNKQDWQMPWKI
jgi:hypothetical protein